MPFSKITANIFGIVPSFNGETETLSEYLDKFNRLLNGFNLSKVSAYKLLISKIEGKAERAYMTAKKSGRIIPGDYQSLVDELGRLLITESSMIKAKYNLALEMKSEETLTQFADRIRRNVQKGYPTFAETHQESLMGDYFTRGVSKDIRPKMMCKVYPTLAAALDRAEELFDRKQREKTTDIEQKMDLITQQIAELKADNVNYMNQDNRQFYHPSYESDEEDYSPEREPFEDSPDEFYNDSDRFNDMPDEFDDRFENEQEQDHFERREGFDDERNDFEDRERFEQEEDYLDERESFEQEQDHFEESESVDYEPSQHNFRSSPDPRYNDGQSFEERRDNFGDYPDRGDRSAHYNSRRAGFEERAESPGKRSGGRSFNGTYPMMLSLAVIALALLPTAAATTYSECSNHSYPSKDASLRCTHTWENHNIVCATGLIHRASVEETSSVTMTCPMLETQMNIIHFEKSPLKMVMFHLRTLHGIWMIILIPFLVVGEIPLFGQIGEVLFFHNFQVSPEYLCPCGAIPAGFDLFSKMGNLGNYVIVSEEHFAGNSRNTEVVKGNATEMNIRRQGNHFSFSAITACSIAFLPVVSAGNENESLDRALSISTHFAISVMLFITIALSCCELSNWMKTEITPTNQRVLIRISTEKSVNNTMGESDWFIATPTTHYSSSSSLLPLPSSPSSSSSLLHPPSTPFQKIIKSQDNANGELKNQY